MNDFQIGTLHDIAPLREKLRGIAKNVLSGQRVSFSFNKTDDENIMRAVIEETGLRYYSTPERGQMEFGRPASVERWNYAFRLAGFYPDTLAPDAKCLDVGSGRNPWPRANDICDANAELAAYAREGQKFSLASVTERLPYEDKQFDFVTCFHVLEHVNDPASAARELSRVGKEGLIECPHPAKDGMLLFLETDHRWFVLPPQREDGPVRFIKINREWVMSLHDTEAQGAAYRMYIGNDDSVGDRAILRNYFARIDPKLNVIHHWKGELKIEVFD